MEVSMLKCKLHRARVTETHVDYEGSCAIDENLMEAAGILEYEEIHMWNVTSGERFITYAIKGERGSRMVSVNGAAAHLVKEQDVVIIAAFARMPPQEAKLFKPALIYLNAENHIERTGETIPVQAA